MTRLRLTRIRSPTTISPAIDACRGERERTRTRARARAREATGGRKSYPCAFVHPSFLRGGCAGLPSANNRGVSWLNRADRDVGPFATFVERVRPDGTVARWESRRHRKHPPGAPAAGSTWWAPRSRGWWIAILFAVGSLLFALGAVPGYASAVGARWDAVTFFVGSLFFTAAGFLTYREAVDAGPHAPSGQPAALLRLPARHGSTGGPRPCNWPGPSSSTSVPAMRCGWTSPRKAANQHVWRPDAVGSVCFLVASALAWFEVCHGWTAWRPRVVVVVDHPGQSGRVGRLRRVRRGRLHQPGDRPAAQRRAVKPRAP